MRSFLVIGLGRFGRHLTQRLIELGNEVMVVDRDEERQIRFLKKIGADHVIHTEMDMAFRVATRFSARNVFDYFELTPKYAVWEIKTPETWEGKTAAEVDVRRRYKVTILGVKNGDEVEPLLDAEYRFQPGTHLLIAGDKAAGLKLM